MDANPDFDYEMEPQAAYAAFQASAEEAMDDLSSEGVPMSDVGVRFEPVDKAAIDVDFSDPASSSKTDAHLSIPTASSTLVEGEEIFDASEALQSAHNHAVEADQDNDDTLTENAHEVISKASSVAEHSGTAPFEAPGGIENRHDGVESSQIRITAIRANDQEGEERDELHHEGAAAASENGVVLATPLAESDQLHDDSGDGEQGQGVNGHAYYPSEEGHDAAIRVTFRGQDFVMWSSADIPAFLAVAHDVEEVESDEVVQIEAPALEVAKDVLWQPLDSLFASLRAKNALGDFLDETHELHIAFPDLDLDVSEDNLYCREITLDDLLQLHHGLGLATSLHIQVAERPRFITKYNELAQHVAGILGNQLEHSSDEEEEAANAGRNAEAVIEPEYESEGLPASNEAVVGGKVGDELVIASSNQAAQADTAGGTPEDAVESVVSESEGQAHRQSPPANAETRAADAGSDVHQQNEQHEPETHEHVGVLEEQDEEEGVDELEGELQGDEEGNSEKEGNSTLGEANHQAALAEDAQDAHGATHQESAPADQEVDGEEAQGEAEYDEANGEDLQGDEEEYEGEYAEEEEEYEEYADDVGDNEAEQTFYTTINDGSDAEEDELEEPEPGAPPQGSALAQPAADAADAEEAYANEAADGDGQEWQDEGEEQIVEYTEEQPETTLQAGSPSSTVSTSYNTGAVQRKRGLDEEDDDDEALYEQDDYEAESKRAKVD